MMVTMVDDVNDSLMQLMNTQHKKHPRCTTPLLFYIKHSAYKILRTPGGGARYHGYRGGGALMLYSYTLIFYMHHPLGIVYNRGYHI
jgi:hypothetical protein